MSQFKWTLLMLLLLVSCVAAQAQCTLLESDGACVERLNTQPTPGQASRALIPSIALPWVWSTYERALEDYSAEGPTIVDMWNGDSAQYDPGYGLAPSRSSFTLVSDSKGAIARCDGRADVIYNCQLVNGRALDDLVRAAFLNTTYRPINEACEDNLQTYKSLWDDTLKLLGECLIDKRATRPRR